LQIVVLYFFVYISRANAPITGGGFLLSGGLGG
jgi:hypothetical protein